ncbi:MAG: chromate transporter [Clostridia bacterium]|nr:chromate transporter [Clostridia bacterium]
MIYLELLWAFIRVGLLSIGGGQAALPIIQSIVTENGWLSLEEFADIVTIAESTPGPIAINAATFTGVKVAGLPGAAVATLGFVLPTVLIVIIISLIYDRFKKSKYVAAAMGGIRPAVVGMIAAAAASIASLTFLGAEGVNITAVLLFCICFIYLRTAKPSPILVILAAGVVGGLIYSL